MSGSAPTTADHRAAPPVTLDGAAARAAAVMGVVDDAVDDRNEVPWHLHDQPPARQFVGSQADAPA